MPNPPTPEEIEGWEKMTNAAKQGPWFLAKVEAGENNVCIKHDHHDLYRGHGENVACMIADDADALFIATARTAMPLLLKEVRRLREDNALMRGVMGELEVSLDTLAQISVTHATPRTTPRL